MNDVMNDLLKWYEPIPETWKKGYQKRDYVIRVNERCSQYLDGLLTMKELAHFIFYEYEKAYLEGKETPNYPVPAIRPYHSWGSDTAHVTIWSGVMQIRISDEPYTGFGKVITFDLTYGECSTRYDDFD